PSAHAALPLHDALPISPMRHRSGQVPMLHTPVTFWPSRARLRRKRPVPWATRWRLGAKSPTTAASTPASLSRQEVSPPRKTTLRSEEHTSELQSRENLV